jgi:hypothetical protein
VKGADPSSGINVLTCSPTGRHPEVTVIKGGLIVGDRRFLFPEEEAPMPPTPRPAGGKTPSTDAAPRTDQPKPATAK